MQRFCIRELFYFILTLKKAPVGIQCLHKSDATWYIHYDGFCLGGSFWSVYVTVVGYRIFRVYCAVTAGQTLLKFSPDVFTEMSEEKTLGGVVRAFRVVKRGLEGQARDRE